eukprot:TRINITY_DN270_c0_g1_i1.p1 TRINITY_DN270_c0_g1~~TRINITY_DN270_c0_g1_i1.p1  ORF type:complete len:304 (-),score=67.65 TRINITY_DN270_c0_g1_i1:406-1317(-)
MAVATFVPPPSSSVLQGCNSRLSCLYKSSYPNQHSQTHKLSETSKKLLSGGFILQKSLRKQSWKSRVALGDIIAQQTPGSAQRSAEADVMDLLLRERIVILGYSIDDFVADVIVSQLLLLDANDPKKDIKLFVNSHGGPLNATLGIFDAIQLCRADVETIALGTAQSSASIILAGGSKGKRFSLPNARIMMHQPFGSVGGPIAEVEVQLQEVLHQKKTVIRILSESTERDPKQVEKDIDRDCYMSPMEAADYGLIDGVIDKDLVLPKPPIPEEIKVRAECLIPPEGVSYVEHVTPTVPDDEII